MTISIEQLKDMKAKKRLQLCREQTFTHYLFAWIFLFPAILTVYSLFEIYVTESYTGVRSASELILTTLPFLILAVVIYIFQKRKLAFMEVKIQLSESEFQIALTKTAEELEWEIESNENNIFRAYRSWEYVVLFGEMITIIKLKDGLLLNCITDPNKRSSPTSFGFNKKNIHRFLLNVKEVKLQTNVHL